MTMPSATATAPPAGDEQPILSLRAVNKSFGAVHVLQDVDFDVYPGQVNALVGDNGAGKSTLIKGVAGSHLFDSGQYLFEGHPVTVHSPKDANALGIEVVYQDLALCDNLDIVDNLYLGRMAAQVKAKDVTSNQVVELITTSRSGSIGLPTELEPDAAELQEGIAEDPAAEGETVSTPPAGTRKDTP